MSQLLARSRKTDPLGRLTPRETEVLALMAEGQSNTAIAGTLVVSARAVEKRTITLITGANKGLGRETARRLLAVGHTVLVGARDAERGRRAAGELVNAAGPALPAPTSTTTAVPRR